MVAVVAGLAILGVGGFLATQQSGEHAILLTSAVATPVDTPPGGLMVSVRIENTGGPDTLLEASSPTAEAVLHAPDTSEGLPIPAASTPSLAADGAHIVLTDLSEPPAPGQLVPLMLRFANAGEVAVKATVGAPQDPTLSHSGGHFGMADICIPEDGEPEPSIALQVRPEEDGWVIGVEAEDFTFNTDLANGPHVPGTGHGHLYLDGLKVQRLYTNEVTIGALPPGKHTVTVTLNTNDHRLYVVDDEPVLAQAVIEVPGR